MLSALELDRKVAQARERLLNVVHKTPLDYSNTFSSLLGGRVYLKLENLQKTGSFKVRGAYFKISALGPEVKQVVTASAGNHAQGVAYASKLLGKRAVVFMPTTAALSKIRAVEAYGAQVELTGQLFDDAYEAALAYVREKGGAFIHPFDDYDIIAGQATVGLEILEEAVPELVVVPIGGGGLISGIAYALKRRLGSNVRIIGVQSEAAPTFYEALKRGTTQRITPKPTIADGIVTKQVGELTLRMVSQYVDDIVLVSDDEIARAIFLLLERCKVLAEGAGAASLAAMLSHKVEVQGKSAVAVISGGNLDLTLLQKLLLREMMAEGRIARIRGEVLDRPGELSRVLALLASFRCNVLDIWHDRVESALRPGWAVVTILFEQPAPDTARRLIARLAEEGYRFDLD
ncbi:MAG: threonine ammonia-lyase [Nitrososphaerota archaeon]